MKKIVLKISLLLIATIFSTHIYSAALAAKEKTAEEVTAGGGAAPAVTSFSNKIKEINDALQKIMDQIDEAKKTVKEYEEICKKEPEASPIQMLIDYYNDKLERLSKFIFKAPGVAR